MTELPSNTDRVIYGESIDACEPKKWPLPLTVVFVFAVNLATWAVVIAGVVLVFG